MDLEAVKEYLRIDGEADDGTLRTMMRSAEAYIRDAAGFYDPDNPKIQLLFALLMQDFYENRVLVVKEADRQRLGHAAASLLLQLQTVALLKEEEEADG